MVPVASARARALRDRSPHRAGRAAAPLAGRPGPRLQDHPPSGRAAGPGVHRHHGPDFLSPRFHTTYHVPTYQEWLEAPGPRPAYEFHRRVLQHLQWRLPPTAGSSRRPPTSGASRRSSPPIPTPSSSRRIAIPSPRSPRWPASRGLQGAFTDELAWRRSALEVTRRWATGLERAMQVRRSGPCPPSASST